MIRGRYGPPSLQHFSLAIASRLPSQEEPLSLIRCFTLWSLHKVDIYRRLVVCLNRCRVRLRDLRAAEQPRLRSAVCVLLHMSFRGVHDMSS